MKMYTVKLFVKRLFCRHKFVREAYCSKPYLGPMNYMGLIHKSHLDDVITHRVDKHYKVCALCGKKGKLIKKTKFAINELSC